MRIGTTTSHWDAIKEALRPWYVWLGGLVMVGLPLYDVGCNQFGWPKIPQLFGMTVSAVPTWGWAILVLLFLIFALFDYVRRLPSLISYPDPPAFPDVRAIVNEVVNERQLAPPPLPPAPPAENPAVANLVISQQRVKLANQLLEQIKGAEDSLEQQPDSAPFLFGGRASPLYLHEQKVSLLGEDGGALTELERKIRDDVRGDAKYITVFEGERFKSGDEKREYEIAKRRLAHLRMIAERHTQEPDPFGFLQQV